MRLALNDVYQVKAERCRRSLYHFIQEFWPVISSDPFVPNWHIEYLCGQLEKVAKRVAEGLPKEHDLIINVPPGTTKTITCSIMFPVWCWTRWYWMRFIAASYSGSLSLESAEYSRDLVRSEEFSRCFPGLFIKRDKDTKSNFRVLKRMPNGVTRLGGNRYSTSVGGTLTGFHGHILIVDDPIDPNRAVSEVELRKANRWIDQTLSTRKVDKRTSVSILIMQRLHQNDPSGHLLAKNKDNVYHICLPGEIRNYKDRLNPPELAVHYEDDLLDRVRMPWSVLSDMEQDLGQYGYAGQIGQKPTPPGGGMFKVDHFQVVDKPPVGAVESTIRYWDKACLCKGTLVSTKRGPVPIEQVVEGDFVLTRRGFCRVVRSWLSKYTRSLATVLLSNGRQITGTPDHLVFSKQRGWTPLIDLSFEDDLVMSQEVATWHEGGTLSYKSTFLMDADIPGGKASGTSIVMNGIRKVRGIFTAHCIGTSGRKPMVLFPVACIFTTRTEIGIITTYRILRSSHRMSIARYIWSVLLPRVSRSQIRSIVEKHRLLLGGDCRNLRFFDAFTAEKRSRRKVLKQGTVPAHVGTDSGGVPVFDLSVEGQPEFFANGVLVHNSTPGGGARTVGVKMSKILSRLTEKPVYVVEDVKKGQWSSEEREQVIRETAEADTRRVEVYIEQEPGSGGKESAEATIRNLSGFVAHADLPVGDKVYRADPYSVQVNLGNVLLLRADWNKEFIEEHRYFPFSTYKDQVDAAAGAFNKLNSTKKKRKAGVWGRR